MDVNMPVSDGIESTAMIREYEKEHGIPPVLVIALTAMAMKGDREKIIQAGMTDYLAKPIDIQKLQYALEKFLPRRESSASQAESTQKLHTQQNEKFYSFEEVSRHIGISAAALKAIVHEFLADSDTYIQNLHSALAASDEKALAQAAHKLKGAAANLHFAAIAELANKIETEAKSGTIPDAKNDIEKIKHLFDTIKRFFSDEQGG
jgi:HPt (histidine-containing phosphotransfer) domain-containing protein